MCVTATTAAVALVVVCRHSPQKPTDRPSTVSNDKGPPNGKLFELVVEGNGQRVLARCLAHGDALEQIWPQTSSE